MLLIPAVDIKDGLAVRLKQGLAGEQTVYDQDPVHAALRWADAGARRIHIVDLDGAFQGQPKNRAITLRILKEAARPGLEFEIGGGLRSAEIVGEFLAAGATRCVIGTLAVEDPGFLKRLAERHPGRINLGLDAKEGLVAIKGWVETSTLRAADLLRSFAGLPLGEVIYTDIARDGMLSGPNLHQLAEIKRVSTFPLIASGGVTTLDHIRLCRELGCFGAIAGKALYDGRLDFNAALQTAL